MKASLAYMYSKKINKFILSFIIRLINSFVAPSISFCGSVGYTTPVSNTFPVSSITANLHPVLYAGSNPNTVNPLSGAPSNNKTYKKR